MNQFILDQLNKVQVANMPPLDLSTTEITILKSKSNSEVVMNINKCYIIEVADYIINPPDNFDLHINWNNNKKPTSKCMKCVVTQILGKMVKIDSVGYDWDNNIDKNDIWTGWIPRKSITKIKEI